MESERRRASKATHKGNAHDGHFVRNAHDIDSADVVTSKIIPCIIPHRGRAANLQAQQHARTRFVIGTKQTPEGHVRGENEVFPGYPIALYYHTVILKVKDTPRCPRRAQHARKGGAARQHAFQWRLLMFVFVFAAALSAAAALNNGVSLDVLQE